jgi:hypothetical protein
MHRIRQGLDEGQDPVGICGGASTRHRSWDSGFSKCLVFWNMLGPRSYGHMGWRQDTGMSIDVETHIWVPCRKNWRLGPHRNSVSTVST